MLLFMLLIVFCLFKAIATQFLWWDLHEIVFALLIGSCLLIIGHRENLVILLLTSIILLQIVLFVLQFCCSEQLINALRILAVIAYLVILNYFCLYFTLQDKTISITTLFGSIAGYLFIGLIFAYVYLFLELLIPTSFSGLTTEHESQAVYFSMITLTTVGYGDVVPLKPISQTLAWIESLIGQFYLAVLIGQMVGRYVARK